MILNLDVITINENVTRINCDRLVKVEVAVEGSHHGRWRHIQPVVGASRLRGHPFVHRVRVRLVRLQRAPDQALWITFDFGGLFDCVWSRQFPTAYSLPTKGHS